MYLPYNMHIRKIKKWNVPQKYIQKNHTKHEGKTELDIKYQICNNYNLPSNLCSQEVP